MNVDGPGGPELPQRRRLVTPIPGPRSRELQERRSRAVPDALTMMIPVFVAAAGGGVLVDVDGNSFIDFSSGLAVTGVGNSARAVVERAEAQLSAYTHASFVATPHEPYVAVCEALNRLTPGDHDKRTVLYNSGAEAVENAVKIARAATGRRAIVVFDYGYHGRTNLTMGMTAKKSASIEAFGPFAGEVYQAPMAYPYRWPEGSARCAEEAADVSLAAIAEQLSPDAIAALVIEPIQGEGGCIEPPPEFLPRLRDFCRDNGIVFVADEVQTGLCRTGDWFACDHAGVVPDLIVTGKGLAGGLPLAAVTGRAELMNAVRTGIGGTFNGNPVACEAALGAIETMRSLDLSSAARRIGEHALPRLWSLADRYAVIGDVRGRGALLGLEVVDPATRRPARKVAAAIARACHAEGLALVVAGKYGNVLRLTPPLVISMKLLTEGLDIIEKVMAGLEAEF